MGLDVKYRPRRYGEVLGQEDTVRILRSFVSKGIGFHQSYLFHGPYGSGKTTLGRILARTLLCADPVEGEPCDKCPSCTSMLDGGVAEGYVEVDAATNSGKDHVRKVVETIQYSTFSGSRRIYLFDEAHQLSKDALDALLKPLEDEEVGSENKRLVCIFCTTEPEKVRETIWSRSAAFRVRAADPEVIAARLAYICDQEAIEYEPTLLQYIAEATECHVRDAIKAVEGISQLGAVDQANVTTFLQLDLNPMYLKVLAHIGQDLPEALSTADAILARVSPLTMYRQLSAVALMTFRLSLGITKLDQFWDRDAVKALADQHGQFLITIARTFAEQPGRPTGAMLQCDLAQLHYGPGSMPARPLSVPAPAASAPPPTPPPTPESETVPTPEPEPTPASASPTTQSRSTTKSVKPTPDLGTVDETPRLLNGGVYTDIRLIRKRQRNNNGEGPGSTPDELNDAEFCRLLRMTISKQDEAKQRRGPAGRGNLDRG